MFSNQGFAQAQTVFVGAHDRAVQYLEQAPILVVWLLPWLEHKAGEVFARTLIAKRCEDGVPLADFVRSSGYSLPLRRLHAKVLMPSHRGVYAMLSRLPPRVLGRIIPPTAKAQRAWLRALNRFAEKAPTVYLRDVDALFQWAAERFAGQTVSVAEAADLADFMFRGDRFNPAWGLKRASEEMTAWHKRLTLDKVMRGLPVGPDDKVDLGAHVDHADLCGWSFTALRTPRQIVEEGAEMRHCVGTYIQAVINGQSHIVSIRTPAGDRAATLELRGPKAMGTFSVRQLRGPHNAQTSPLISSAAQLYSGLMIERWVKQ